MHVLDCMLDDVCDQFCALFDGRARLLAILAQCSEHLVLSYVDA